MKQIGDVIYSDILKDYKGDSKGKGIVEFKYKEDMHKCLDKYNETSLDGRKIYLHEVNNQI
jgi:RNA recognition motif-containing protein